MLSRFASVSSRSFLGSSSTSRLIRLDSLSLYSRTAPLRTFATSALATDAIPISSKSNSSSSSGDRSRYAFNSMSRFLISGLALYGIYKFASSCNGDDKVIHAAAAPAGVLPLQGIPGTNTERTFIAIKPDGVQRGLIAKIIARFEEKGFQLVGIKLLIPTLDQASGHYDDLKNKPFFPSLVRFFSSGPVIAMVWQGKGSILTGRRLLGETDPAKSAPGSIRGDYSIDIGRNIIHGSDGPEGAAHEIQFWFKPEEIFNWQPTQNIHIYEKP